jgi:alpha-amylase/alpha-mannosidase (GH57 family)
MRFVILAPDQAERVRLTRMESWSDVTGGRVDSTQPYRYFHHDGSGRSLAIFFYNGPLARAIAFEQALTSSTTLVRRFLEVAKTGPLVNVATDGETYGHHFKFGDLCLAYALEIEAKEAGFNVTNYGEFLAQSPPEFEVKIQHGPLGEGSSWSCAHGVGRWIRDCGCHTGGEPGWNQQWRGPLRTALNFLRDATSANFEKVGGNLLWDPWAARNDYIQLILQTEMRELFLAQHARRALSSAEQTRALTLLEIQRHSLLMFTSCGWFFSELSGIETIQVMRYAARVIELQTDLGLTVPRARFLELMAEAKSNLPEKGNGAEIYLRYAESLPSPVPTEPIAVSR